MSATVKDKPWATVVIRVFTGEPLRPTVTPMTAPIEATSFVDFETLLKHLDRDKVRARVMDAMASTAVDFAVCGVPGELLFDSPRGDCHVKYGYLASDAHFVVKVATGFYDNDASGRPVNGGVVLLFSKRTGLLGSIVSDGGFFTAWRTAAVGSLASRALAPPDVQRIAVIGTGQQAELQAIWHRDLFPEVPIVVAGRDEERAQRLVANLADGGLRLETSTIADAVGAADVIVTATSATAPLFAAGLVGPGTHVTAVGADAAGKQELDPSLLSQADIIATDDHHQCLEGGEFGNAVRAGTVADSVDIALATVLDGTAETRSPDAITVADLTGLTVQDLAIASFFRERLGLAE